jgi:threonine dehydratase
LIEHPLLNEKIGARALIKAENLQRTGSFKFRGAFNRLVQIPERERAKGVVAWSSGNHAQGVAAAAQRLGIPATIVMPEDAPSVKLNATRDYGAEIVAYDRYSQSREDIARDLVRRRGATLVPSFDDPDIMIGQGTAGLELAEQAGALGVHLDAVLVCCGGGGLIAGMASALHALSPKTSVYSVEPEGFDDYLRSLKSGARETNDPDARSICDALLAPAPGELTFAVNRSLLAGGLAVSDDEAMAAVRFAALKLKLIAEPGGAVALAALLTGKLRPTPAVVGVVISGGNIDTELLKGTL